MSRQWERVEEIFHSALALSSAERDQFLTRECGPDHHLKFEVEELLRGFESSPDLLETPVFDVGLSALESRSRKQLVGRILGGYSIEEKIGEGGMGEVFRATDLELNRTVALKFLADSVENDPRARRQLKREARSAAALDHPNICAVYGLEESDGLHFIVMQHIAGRTLAEILKERRIESAEFRSLAKQMIEAVAFAHSHGILHRDLKPGNIMVTDDGRVMILDFGLATPVSRSPLLEAGEDTARNSIDAALVGTVAYMSPEQLRGERLDFKSDIFSLGIVLHEMLTGENPFARPTQAETIAAILGNELSFEKNRIGVDERSWSIVRSALSKDPAERTLSAADILIAFESNSTRFGLNYGLAVSIVFVAVFCILIVFYNFWPPPEKRRLAILPIALQTNSADSDVLAFRLRREIGAVLAAESELELLSESATDPIDPNQFDPVATGRLLNVDAIVVGRMTVNDRSFPEISISLTRASDNSLIDRFNVAVDPNMISIASRSIAERITQITRSEPRSVRAASRRSPISGNAEAIRQFWNGRFYLERRNETDLQLAERSFTSAIDQDPTFAEAWAGLANTYVLYSVPGYSYSIDPKTARRNARDAAERAIRYDATLAAPYNSLGSIELKFNWDWSEAERLFRQAIDLNPNEADAHLGLASLYTIRGRFDEALDEARRAKEISPLAISADLSLVSALYFKRDWGSMERLMDEAFIRYPDHRRLRYFAGLRHIALKNYGDAYEVFSKLFAEDRTLGAAPLGFVCAKLKRFDEAESILNELKQNQGNRNRGYVSAQETAIIYVGMGKFDEAFNALYSACSDNFPAFPFVPVDPLFDDLRTDSRFESLRTCARL